MQVNVLEAKNSLSQLIRSAQAGEEVVIANRGQPVAKLVPIHPTDSAETGQERPRDFVAWLRANPLPAHLQRSHELIEAGIQAERESWD
ncbi:type II toxin-antitoxin system prevent-host-death family antitoxin [Paucibacter sp. R3-3]|uniref:Antitoxin n=1 Tax=Roseateles agri TaxID=3098619 RepID=A0ABU5DB92_9BURK|nr:type II toxin-antitoxin system prevent-host-death family antitoxin [Paucibacter sp. R3-3]MDY0743556.1 type II toxin-antitoxin system prevent-host-death family antitoxin [Paucibacter sp. R3-3]